MGVLNEDRRVSRRRTLQEVPTIIGVSVQSHAVQVINISTWGLLIRCSIRLPPGASYPLEIARTSGSHRTRARVVRCEVAEISSHGIGYCAALRLDRRLDFVDPDPWTDFDAAEPSGEVGNISTILAGHAQEWQLQLTLNGW